MANNSSNRNGGPTPRNRNINNPGRPTATSDRPVAAPPNAAPPPNNDGPRRMTPKQQAMLRRQQIRRRNQLIWTSVLVVVVIAVIGVIIYAVSQSNKVTVSDKASSSTADTAPFTIGDPNSKVTLTEWGDFRCSACDLFFNNVEPTVMDSYVKTGKIKFVFKNFITIDAHDNSGDSHRAAEAAWCAADQNHFWDYYKQLYSNYPGENPGFWTAGKLKEVAAQLGLDTNKFNTCLDSGQHRQDVTNQNQQATQNGYGGTPTLTVNDKPMTANFSDVNAIKTELDNDIVAANGTPGANSTTGANTTPGAANTTTGAATTSAAGTPGALATTSAASTTSAAATTSAANPSPPGATPTK